jgi:dTDP-4-amino-4,6-dideoxygalactose transaminase
LIPSLPTLDPVLGLASARRAPAVYPFDRPGRAFYLARAGVYRAVRALARGGVVLMPAYHHGVEVEAVRATGSPVRFYRIDRRMRVDLEALADALAAPDVRCVYVTHFVGFAQEIAAIAELCRARAVPLVEDCALALFSRTPAGAPLGQTGDAAIFCLYKSLPVPHGGLVVGLPVAAAERPPPLGSTLHHAAGLALAHAERRWPFGRSLRAIVRRGSRGEQIVKTGTQHLAPGDLELGASRLVDWVVARTDADAVVRRRRHNFRRIADALAGEHDVIGAPLAPGACPLFVPVRVADKPLVASALQAQGIDAIDFWNTPTPGEDEDTAALRREVLELPCHQSLDDEDVDEVIAKFRRSVRRIGR